MYSIKAYIKILLLRANLALQGLWRLSERSSGLNPTAKESLVYLFTNSVERPRRISLLLRVQTNSKKNSRNSAFLF